MRPSCARDTAWRPQSLSGDADGPVGVTSHRHGHRSRSLNGNLRADRNRGSARPARRPLHRPDDGVEEQDTAGLSAPHRRPPSAPIAKHIPRRHRQHVPGTGRALAALFGGAVGKDTVSRVWRKVKADWEAWNARSLAEEPIVRLILDGTVVRVRLDRKATSISLLVVIGVREDGQKVLLALKNMGGESTEAWRAVLDDLVSRGLRRPAFLIVDGASGLEKAIAAVWDGVPVQRCTVHKVY